MSQAGRTGSLTRQPRSECGPCAPRAGGLLPLPPALQGPFLCFRWGLLGALQQGEDSRDLQDVPEVRMLGRASPEPHLPSTLSLPGALKGHLGADNRGAIQGAYCPLLLGLGSGRAAVGGRKPGEKWG